MNKFVLATALFFGIASGQAQEISYGLKAGPYLSNGVVKTSSKTYRGSSPGFHAGAFADITLSDNFLVQPALLLCMKNAKVSDLNGINIHLWTIDLPVTALYSRGKFFGGIGPNFSFGLSGHYKYRDDKYNLYKEDNNGLFSIKRFELGANILAGYRINEKYLVSAHFTQGLTNLFNDAQYTNSDTKVKTSVLGVSLGYRL